MIHFSLLKEYDFWAAELDNISVSYFLECADDFKDVLYVTEHDKYIGCVGKKEINRSIRENTVTVNRNSQFVCEGKDAETEAKHIFISNPRIKKIPVVDADMHILYQYSYDYDHYYEHIDIEKGVNTENDGRKEKIIVSMTSYGSRLSTVHIAIKSLMCQTLKADKILLYLADIDSDIKLPDEDKLKSAGLEIKRGVEDLGAHKKYYYSMQDYADDIIITADDDQLYDDRTIETLYEKHLLYPEAVITMRGHGMTKKDGKLLPYDQWRNEISSEYPAFDAIATGVAGVLYPPGKYRNSFFDIEAIRSICLRQDDIWLKFNELRNRVKTYVVGEMPPFFIKNTQDENSLCEYNGKQGGNDKCIKELSEYYDINIADFIEEVDCEEDRDNV